ncbi:MAG TPA: HAD family hydrolase, partial [Desulfobaccales bacterium]
MSPVPSIDLDHFEAVLFDLDGVLTATAKVHAACWKQAFDEFLKRRAAKNQETFRPFDSHDYDEYVDGKPRADGLRSFLQSRGIKLPQGHPDDPPDRETMGGLGNRKNELFNQALESKGVEVFASSLAWLRQLRQAGIKTAVVSASKHCQVILKVTGIADLFDARVDGNVAEELNLKGKPAPDTYLKAAEMVGVPPR